MNNVPESDEEDKLEKVKNAKLLKTYRDKYGPVGFVQVPKSLINGAARDMLGLTQTDIAVCLDIRRRQSNSHFADTVTVRMVDTAKSTGYARSTIWKTKERLVELQLASATSTVVDHKYQPIKWCLYPLWIALSEATGESFLSMFGKKELDLYDEWLAETDYVSSVA